MCPPPVVGGANLPASVWAALERAQGRGFIGPGDLEAQARHAFGFVEALEQVRRAPLGQGELVLDLGSGGGLPGLIVMSVRPTIRMALLEGSVRRAAFLADVVASTGLGDRVEVLGQRAEVVGRDPSWRGRVSAVTARGFGGPAETAECAAPLLVLDGLLVVSEPPGSDGTRWESVGLGVLGLELESVREAGGSRFAVVRQRGRCPDRFPRRVGVPRKRPLF